MLKLSHKYYHMPFSVLLSLLSGYDTLFFSCAVFSVIRKLFMFIGVWHFCSNEAIYGAEFGEVHPHR